MTEQQAVSMLLSKAKGEVGYIEKKSRANLDDKKLNAGRGNYTKYARDLYPKLQGSAWCDMYVDWVFVKVFGLEVAMKMLGGFSAYTPTSAQYFKNIGRQVVRQNGKWAITPQPGWVIFFKNSSRICHTGLVTYVDGVYVYTNEGNTSSGKDVIPNGGSVCEKQYTLTNQRIACFGNPDFKLAKDIVYVAS